MRVARLFSSWRKERLGLAMIIASLAVIMVTVGLLFVHQQQTERENISKQGISLTRVLSRLPLAQLVPQDGHQGVFSVFRHSLESPAFAYLAIVDIHGAPLAEITSPGIIIPAAPPPADPTTWLGERTLSLPVTGRNIHEFHAPVLEQGQIAAYIRLGYFEPGFGLRREQVPFFASFALPIFLLTPLFYFLVRREVRPLQQVNKQIDKLVGKGGLPKVELTASGEMHDFVIRFSKFVNTAQKHIDKLEADRAELLTSTKLLDYKRARIESVLQSFPDPVIVLDESGSVSLANPGISNVLGISHDKINGRKPAEWCDNRNVVTFLARHEGSVARRHPAESMEFNPPSCPEKTIAISPFPLFSPRDPSQVLGTLVIFRDVTSENIARKRSGEFVARVAHELKTPLNILMMYSEMLLGDDSRNSEFRIEASNVIHDEVERLAMLINNMLSITRIEMGSIEIERKRVKLRELLQDVFDTSARNGQKDNINFHLDLPREISPVALDKNLMRIAISNLLTNAIKYSNPGGTVTMRVEETEQTIRISVHDEGIGIEPGDLERIFDKFYRSEREEVRSRPGHGLGLSLAREIIQLHHGNLTVSSIPGEGTEFTAEFHKETELLKQAI